jgi:hypothetical protein
MTTDEKKQRCKGCRDDYYNEPGHSTSGQCWMLDGAQPVTRYKLGWWTQPTQPGAFTKVETLSCWNAPGQFAMRKDLPDFITPAERARIEGR